MQLDGLKLYLDDLASASPVPGGGVAAAVTLAQGLALLSMVCNLTIGKKRFVAVEGQVKEILERVSGLRAEALCEAEADMSAFGIVMNAYQMPTETDEQKSIRKAVLAEATRGAAEPPFRLMTLAVQAYSLADQLEQIGNPAVISDVLVGRHLLIAGYKSSRENVEVNLNNLSSDDPFAGEMKSKMAELGAASACE
ncbi:MAG: cyclodeaminase/cyclohydrolase family protein [Gammaproteobacteria bacterium]|nr:cyclodeaminase/cyclohydrolase family protein [Gammaproteobacteria bacterium]MBU1960845.1 cyclodeaminase/cyclohydrolase family protein [Gammaproteobacteria bacterium]